MSRAEAPATPSVPAADGSTGAPRSVLVTGVAGRVGRSIWPDLVAAYPEVRGVDVRPATGLAGDVRQADLAVLDEAVAVVRGTEAVVHLAGIPDEAEIGALVQANVVGTWNVLEAARRAGVRRVVLASSHHVVGFYPRGTMVGPASPVRPDSAYAVTKVAIEAVGRLFHDKFGLEVVCLRIGSFRPHAESRRQLSTWLSPADGVRLVRAALDRPGVGFAVVFGSSVVEPSWWDNPDADLIGYEPIDRVDSATFAEVSSIDEPGIGGEVQGGHFADPDYRGGRG